MSVEGWPTLDNLLAAEADAEGTCGERSSSEAQRQWWGATVALERLLAGQAEPAAADTWQGVVLSGPVPAVDRRSLPASVVTRMLTPACRDAAARNQRQLPACPPSDPWQCDGGDRELPLPPQDPLAGERFCLVLTRQFGLVMTLAQTQVETAAFRFSFDPELVQQAWATLQLRLRALPVERGQQLIALGERFEPPCPHYRTVAQFSRQLLANLPEPPSPEARSKGGTPRRQRSRVIPLRASDGTSPGLHRRQAANEAAAGASETELLQALTHEIRTPLTTIRTLARLLLKRQDVGDGARERVRAIDRECSDRIDHMELIFQAAECERPERARWSLQLAPVALEQLLQDGIPRWQERAQRRNIALEVSQPEMLPQVVTEPALLDRALTGLMDTAMGRLPDGASVRLCIVTAGSQLKLQLLTPAPVAETAPAAASRSGNRQQSVGQVLTFHPETGDLSLSLEVAKTLFQALGGKLTVRQHSVQGEVLTAFLPLNARLDA